MADILSFYARTGLTCRLLSDWFGEQGNAARLVPLLLETRQPGALPVSVKQLIQRSELPPATVWRRVRTLARKGYLRPNHYGPVRTYRLTDAGVRALITIQRRVEGGPGKPQ